MREREMETARRFGILDKVQAFEKALNEVEYVIMDDMSFDLSGWWSNIRYVIIVPRYTIPASDEHYYDKHRALVANIIDKAAQHGLKRTQDRIEDYGAHYYIVFKCDDSWPRATA